MQNVVVHNTKIYERILEEKYHRNFFIFCYNKQLLIFSVILNYIHLRLILEWVTSAEHVNFGEQMMI